MLKRVFILVLLFTLQLMKLSAHAAEATEAEVCTEIECATTSGQTAMEALKRFAEEMHTITNGILDIEVISDKMNYADKCDNFVGNGEVNRWGKVIKKELDKAKYNTLLISGTKDLGQYCSNFSELGFDDRKAVFVLILTAMTHYESSCNFREKAPGPNGTAVGLLQLHKGQEAKYSSSCRNGDASNPERSLICGLSMLNDQVVERGERLFSSASYWEVLRPRGRSQKAKKIMTALKQFPACSKSSEVNVKKVTGTRKNKSPRVAKR